MTNQIAATYKLHSTKSDSRKRGEGGERGGICVIESSDKTRIQHAAPRVVRAFVQGRDVFVSLPTGSGKSLCYCLLPLLFDGSQRKSIVVVVRALLHICLLELCSLFLWLSVAAHVQRSPRNTFLAGTKTCRECFSSPFPRPLLIRACVHAEKLRLARETTLPLAKLARAS